MRAGGLQSIWGLRLMELPGNSQETPRRLPGAPRRLPEGSLNVDLDPGGYLEDLGAILEVLAPMVITCYYHLNGLEKLSRLDPSIRFEKFMENCQEITISNFGFRSTFKERRVMRPSFFEACRKGL